MGHRLNDTTRRQLETMFQRNMRTCDIAAQLGLKTATVSRNRTRYRVWGTLDTVRSGKLGRPPILLPHMEDALLELLDQEDGNIYLDEAQEFLYDEFGVWPNISTISRTLRRLRITRKKSMFLYALENLSADYIQVQRIPLERNEHTRAHLVSY